MGINASGLMFGKRKVKNGSPQHKLEKTKLPVGCKGGKNTILKSASVG